MQRYRLLVVEDNPGDVELLREAFLTHGMPCEITAFRDGEKALNYLAMYWDSKQEIPHDVILLDLNLPRVDGFAILDTMRPHATPSGPLTLVMTSSNSPKDRERVSGYPIDRMIIKPADLDEFLSIALVIRQMLENRRPSSAGDGI